MLDDPILSGRRKFNARDVIDAARCETYPSLRQTAVVLRGRLGLLWPRMRP